MAEAKSMERKEAEKQAKMDAREKEARYNLIWNAIKDVLTWIKSKMAKKSTQFRWLLLWNCRLESLRKQARRILGLDIFKPQKPNLSTDDDYIITPETTALRSTVSSIARAKATEIQKSKVTTNKW